MMSIHKLTAGDGYVYLVRQTAAHDDEKRGRTTLADYYSDKGETPGEWTGRGLDAFHNPAGRELTSDYETELWRIGRGSQVTEDQMRALFGLGLHPNAGRIAEHLILRGAGKGAARSSWWRRWLRCPPRCGTPVWPGTRCPRRQPAVR